MDSFKPKCWSELPGVLLEQIYSYLNSWDQCQMSLACRNWSNEYHAPSLWQNRVVKLSFSEKHQLDSLLTLVEQRGHLFRHLDIDFSSLNTDLTGPHEKLKCLLELLTRKSTLLTIKLRNLSFAFRHLDGICGMYEEIIVTLQNLLRRQTCLRELGFYGEGFEVRDAAEILQAISVDNTPSLRHLTLRDVADAQFRKPSEEGSMSSGFLQAFMNLNTLETEYTTFFVNTISTLLNLRDEVLSQSSRAEGNLKTIKLLCRNFRSQTSITPEAWNNLIDMCPSVRVDMKMYINSTYIRILIARFIVLNMPLRSLDYCQEKAVYTFQDLQILLNQLLRCETTQILEELIIAWPNSPLIVEHDLGWFINVCPKLKVFRLCASHPVEGLDIILNAWYLCKPEYLKIVDISVLNVFSERDKADYRLVAETYVPLLEALGLQITFTAGTALENAEMQVSD